MNDILAKTGKIIHIKRSYMLKSTKAKKWNQINFIVDENNKKICSRVTLFKLEKGEVTPSFSIYSPLLKKLNTVLFTNEQQLNKFNNISNEIKSNLAHNNLKDLKALHSKVVRINTNDEVILSEYKMLLLVILNAYVNKVSPNKKELDRNIELALVINKNLAHLLINTYWNLCLTEWTEYTLKEKLYQYMTQVNLDDTYFYAKIASMSYRLNYYFNTLKYTNQVLHYDMKEEDMYVFGSCLHMNFSTLRKLDMNYLHSRYSYYNSLIDKFSDCPIAACQFYLEFGLYHADIKNFVLAKELIEKALALEPYLTISYFPSLYQFKFLDRNKLFLISEHYRKSMSAENYSIISFYKKIHDKEDPQFILDYFENYVINNINNTSFDCDSLIPQLRHEILLLAKKGNRYKSLYILERYISKI